MELISKYSALIENRENLYKFLGRIYKVEIDQTLLDQMKEMSFPTECLEDELSKGYAVLENYLRHYGNDPLTDLAVDYARVFLGAGIASAEAAYPYESVYTSPKRLMMQEARDQVLKIYHANGLYTVEEFDEPEDHLALEFEFMAYLCHVTQEALSKCDWPAVLTSLEAQFNFLKKHLLNWVPAFCADIEKYAETDFYQAVAKITNGYLAIECSMIEDIIAETAQER